MIPRAGIGILEQDGDPPRRHIGLDKQPGADRHALTGAHRLQNQVARHLHPPPDQPARHPAPLQPVRRLGRPQLFQPGQVGQFLGVADGAPGQHSRCGDHHHRRRDQQFAVQTRPTAGAKAQGDVDAARRQFDQLGRGVDHQVDIGMRHAKLGQARHQPIGSKGRCDRQVHRARGVAPGQFLHHRADRAEPHGQRLRQLFALAGQGQRATRPVQQGNAQVTLQRAQMLADRRMSHVQRRAGADHIASLGKGGKGPQRGERGHVAPIHL